MKKMLLLCIAVFAVALFVVSCSKKDDDNKPSEGSNPVDTNVYAIASFPADGTSYNSGSTFKIYAVTTINGSEVSGQSVNFSMSHSPNGAGALNGFISSSGEANGKNLTITGTSGEWVQITLSWASKGVSTVAKYYIN
jgi:hypothetical protein